MEDRSFRPEEIEIAEKALGLDEGTQNRVNVVAEKWVASRIQDTSKPGINVLVMPQEE